MNKLTMVAFAGTALFAMSVMLSTVSADVVGSDTTPENTGGHLITYDVIYNTHTGTVTFVHDMPVTLLDQSRIGIIHNVQAFVSERTVAWLNDSTTSTINGVSESRVIALTVPESLKDEISASLASETFAGLFVYIDTGALAFDGIDMTDRAGGHPFTIPFITIIG